MITYQYQILRFLPDRVNEEFVNLGVVVFDPQQLRMRSRFIDKVSRVSAFFPDINGRYLHNTLKFMQGEFDSLTAKLANELRYNKFSSLDEITKSILPKDDSALIFSETKKGRDIDLDVVCNELFERVVFKNLSDHDEFELRSDREVWNKVYKEFFERHNILNHLQPHTIKTKDDHLQFDKAYKNGTWNCFETISFNLVRPESVKNKVYKWAGKLEELKTSTEPVSLYLLTVLPENEELKKFINRKLNNKTFEDSTVKLITEDKAESLAKKVQREIESHQ